MYVYIYIYISVCLSWFPSLWSVCLYVSVCLCSCLCLSPCLFVSVSVEFLIFCSLSLSLASFTSTHTYKESSYICTHHFFMLCLFFSFHLWVSLCSLVWPPVIYRLDWSVGVCFWVCLVFSDILLPGWGLGARPLSCCWLVCSTP